MLDGKCRPTAVKYNGGNNEPIVFGESVQIMKGTKFGHLILKSATTRGGARTPESPRPEAFEIANGLAYKMSLSCLSQ